MDAGKELCIIHGNCQGETLAALLSASPEFVAAWRVEYYVNFTRQAIPEESVRRCGLLLHQHLGGQWGELSSDALRARLARGARAFSFPNMLFKGYWPFWSGEPGFDYRDTLLDSLLDRGMSPPEALALALRLDLDRLYGLGCLLADTLSHERAKERESDVKYVDLIVELFRAEKLFQSVNHPRKRLMLHAADAVLALLGLPPLPDDFKAACPGLYPEFELPIHPKVAAFHGLEFCGAETRFNVYGQSLTYREYAALYLDCKASGRSDFIAYLQGR